MTLSLFDCNKPLIKCFFEFTKILWVELMVVIAAVIF